MQHLQNNTTLNLRDHRGEYLANSASVATCPDIFLCNMVKEIWRPISGYEYKYSVSNLGKVKNVLKNKLLKESVRGKYLRVCLISNENVYNHKSIHRLVAEEFISNPNNKKQVNHIDFNGFNNCASNLEWCSAKENTNHSRINNRYPKTILTHNQKENLKKINSKKVIDVDTGIVYNSASEASRVIGIKKSTLIHYLIGSRKNKTKLKYL